MPGKELEPPRNKREAIAAAANAIQERLPRTWDLQIAESRALHRGDEYDAEFRLYAPNGLILVLFVEAKNVVRPQDVDRVSSRLTAATLRHPGSIGLLFARHLSASTRQRLQEAEISYLDATGNMMVRADEAAIFLSAPGAETDPWRGPGRPPGNLKGEPAAKVVRALLDFQGPWKTSHLVEAAEVSTGSAYRVLDFLQREALIVRQSNGVVVPDWVALLRRWSQDYQFLKTNTISPWIAPRGLPALLDRIHLSGINDYAVTGSIAAATWQSYAPPRSAMVYVDDPARAAEAWKLRSIDTGANVLLAVPAYPVLLARSGKGFQDIRIAAPTQVAADLMTGPGRAPSEAQELLDWMGTNEQSWRHR
ncbi:type IV toxin-antitoxin system AbiEi family antitoxin [Nocardia neocaledoniensis]|uniref:type IV toxin-antitoxin system AbiEi family antitoxin n=1 Tax=Nocardia neocaledoniensis TaxID=236511 RepID=UPI0024548D5B|nr:type IV toxin-antitoxin system AbiEi family antitoxin [Nocardia neocaledoniensis]